MCIVHIEKSYDTTFIMGCGVGGGGVQRPHPIHYGSVKSHMHERVKLTNIAMISSWKINTFIMSCIHKIFFLVEINGTS